jgi:hypothetical protein
VPFELASGVVVLEMNLLSSNSCSWFSFDLGVPVKLLESDKHICILKKARYSGCQQLEQKGSNFIYSAEVVSFLAPGIVRQGFQTSRTSAESKQTGCCFPPKLGAIHNFQFAHCTKLSEDNEKWQNSISVFTSIPSWERFTTFNLLIVPGRVRTMKNSKFRFSVKFDSEHLFNNIMHIQVFPLLVHNFLPFSSTRPSVSIF